MRRSETSHRHPPIWQSIAILVTLAVLLGGCASGGAKAKKTDTPTADTTAPAEAGKTAPDQSAQADPHSGPSDVKEIPAVPSPIKDQDAVTERLTAVARDVKVGGAAMGTDKAQIMVAGDLVSAILNVDATGAGSKAAYLGKMLAVAQAVTNEAMKVEGVARIRLIVESDGSFGSPKDDLAVSLVYEKEKVAPAQWGNLASTDTLLAAATQKTVAKSLQ